VKISPYSLIQRQTIQTLYCILVAQMRKCTSNSLESLNLCLSNINTSSVASHSNTVLRSVTDQISQSRHSVDVNISSPTADIL